MKTKLTLVLAVIILYALSPIFGQWKCHKIDAGIEYTFFVAVDDMDSDGDMGLVVTEYGSNMIRLSPFMQQNYQNARFFMSKLQEIATRVLSIRYLFVITLQKILF
ncbi:MAG: hypothetical protein JSV22_01180 [Bacteroidales bacterium]|nr:MAG: hypothetical protein JSV22_01180 [Bacteroidales bacterium]